MVLVAQMDVAEEIGKRKDRARLERDIEVQRVGRPPVDRAGQRRLGCLAGDGERAGDERFL